MFQSDNRFTSFSTAYTIFFTQHFTEFLPFLKCSWFPCTYGFIKYWASMLSEAESNCYCTKFIATSTTMTTISWEKMYQLDCDVAGDCMQCSKKPTIFWGKIVIANDLHAFGLAECSFDCVTTIFCSWLWWILKNHTELFYSRQKLHDLFRSTRNYICLNGNKLRLLSTLKATH